jgi:hypothetical protein
MAGKLSQAFAEALKPTTHTFIRYGSPPGFGVRVTPTGARSWVFDYRPGGGRRATMRRLTLGKVEDLPFAKARRRAAELFHKTRLGEDPAGVRDDKRAAPTLEAVAERFMAEEIRPARKPATARYYDNLLRIHILPALGSRRARELTHSDVAKLHRAIGAIGTQVTANRAVERVSSLYGWAGKAGEVPRDTNPARDVSRFREQARTRYLSDHELARLGASLELGETEGLPYTATREARPQAGKPAHEDIALRRGRDPAACADRLPARRSPESEMVRGRSRARFGHARGLQDGRPAGVAQRRRPRRTRRARKDPR